MPFLQMPKISTVESEIASDRARRLRDHVVKTTVAVRRWRVSAWADEFRKLQNEVSKSTEPVNIDEVLDNYIRNHNKKGYPRITSAAAFRKLFDWCVRLYLSEQLEKKPELSKEHTHLAKNIYDAVRTRNWGPAATMTNLEISIHRSVSAQMRLALLLSVDKPSITPTTKFFVKHVRGTMTGTAFIVQWYLDLWKSVKDWTAWSGSFTPFEIALDSKKFHERGIALAKGQGDVMLWSLLCTIYEIPLPKE